MYINIETNELITRAQLEATHTDPLVIFPAEVGDESLAEFGYANVVDDVYPELTAQQTIEKGAVVRSGDQYIQTWTVVDIPVLAEQVNAERDRRIDAGVTFNGVLYQSTPGDRENIAGAAQMAFMAIMIGAQPGDLRWASENEDFRWIAMDNSRVPMDAHTVVAFGKAAAARKQAMVFAGSDLKALSPIPSDYTDDQWWPA